MIKSIRPKTTSKMIGGGADIQKKLALIMKQAKNAYVTIGFHEDAGRYTKGENPPEVIEVALWNEMGTKTTPSRPFIRTAIDENSVKIDGWRDYAIANMVLGNWDLAKALEFMGTNIQTLIQNKIKSNMPPPLAEATKEAKKREGSLNWGRTLMDSELMLRSVTFKVHL